MQLNIYSIIALLTFLIVLFVGVFVYAQNTKNRLNKVFLVFSVVGALLSFLDYEVASSNTYYTAWFWMNIEKVWPLVLTLQLHFLLVFTKKIDSFSKKWMYILYGITGFIIYVSFNYTSFDLINVRGFWMRLPENFQINISIILVPFMLFNLIITNYIGIVFLSKSSDKKIRIQTLLVLLGIMVPTLLSILKNGVLPSFNISLLVPESLGIFFGWIFIVTATWFYKLFNITPETAADKIISTMNDALLLLDNNNKIVHTNKAFQQIFGTKNTLIAGKTIDTLQTVDKDFAKSVNLLINKEELKNKMFTIKSPSNEILHINFSNSQLYDDTGKTIGNVCVISDVTELIGAQKELEVQHKLMLKMAHHAGMSEIATDVIHNIGNILNTITISIENMNAIIYNSKITGLKKATSLLEQNRSSSLDFKKNKNCELLMDYFIKLDPELEKEQKQLLTESKLLLEKVNLIKEVIDTQQEYATARDFIESVNITSLVDEVIHIHENNFIRANIAVRKSVLINENLNIEAPKSKLVNVLLNVIKNAYDTLLEKQGERFIDIQINSTNNERIIIKISDNGKGISEEILKNIFNYGFTTKPNGHGFGLHFCANVLKEMDGSIHVESKGPGKGSSFIITLPVHFAGNIKRKAG
ncbi:MAG: PAS domain S-box protein [Bacteroidales bacterium]|nr:PAS domain S-box protein [Bacteroidales bacterium]